MSDALTSISKSESVDKNENVENESIKRDSVLARIESYHIIIGSMNPIEMQCLCSVMMTSSLEFRKQG